MEEYGIRTIAGLAGAQQELKTASCSDRGAGTMGDEVLCCPTPNVSLPPLSHVRVMFASAHSFCTHGHSCVIYVPCSHV